MSEELGEHMHQDLGVMEERYQGFWDTTMMPYYSWSLIRHFPKSQRRAFKRSFLKLHDYTFYFVKLVVVNTWFFLSFTYIAETQKLEPIKLF